MTAVGFCLVCSNHYDAESFVGHSCTTPRRFTCGGCGDTFPAYEFWTHHCTFHDAVMRLFKPAAGSPPCGVGRSEADTPPTRGSRHLAVVARPTPDPKDGDA